MDASSLRSRLAGITAGCRTWLLWTLASLLLAAAHPPARAQTCVTPPPGMVAWWPMDETAGTTVADIVGTNPGIRVNGPASAPGLVGGSLRFNGSSSYVGAPDSDLWAFGTADFTIELWANWDFNPVGSVGHPGTIFIGNDEGAGSRNKWFFALGGGFLNFHINSPAIGPRFFPLVPFSPVVSQWYHLAVTRRGNIYIVYVNGTLAGSAIDNNPIPNPSSPLTIGQAESLGFMNGRLDEMTVYNRALSQPEIQTIASAGASGKCKALQITTRTLPSVRLGSSSSTALRAVFGRSPYSWAISSGTLPAGMTLAPDGTLTGTPREAGAFDFMATVLDVDGRSAHRSLTQTILLAPPASLVKVNKAGTAVVPGRSIDYFIVAENTGESTESVALTELLLPPNHFSFESTSPAAIVQSPVELLWILRDLVPSDVRVLHYRVRLNPTLPRSTEVAGCVIDDLIGELVGEITGEIVAKIEESVWEPLKEAMRKLECTDKTWIQGVANFCPGKATQVLNWQACAEALNLTLKGCKSSDHKLPRAICDIRLADAAIDPNEKVVIAKRFIRSSQVLVFVVHFENIGTIEARDVYVTDVLDPSLDLSTLKLLTAGATLDLGTRNVKWNLLNRNLAPRAGDSVLMQVRPRPGLPSGTVIRNTATIQFEVFDPISTNEVVNIIDDVAPQCKLDPLPPVTRTLTFPVSWKGSDVVGEVESYSVWMSKDRAAFTPLLEATKTTTTPFTGVAGSRYDFLCVAKDTAGNIEIKPAAGEVTTFVELLPADLNGDGKVDCADLGIVKASFGKRTGQSGYDPRADVNRDGVVDVRDLAFVSQRLPVGTRCS